MKRTKHKDITDFDLDKMLEVLYHEPTDEEIFISEMNSGIKAHRISEDEIDFIKDMEREKF